MSKVNNDFRDLPDVGDIDEAVADPARKFVATHAKGADDLSMLLDMLGIWPATYCTVCGDRLPQKATGLCKTCAHKQKLAAERKAGRTHRSAEAIARAAEIAARPKCACGRVAMIGFEICRHCRDLAPIEELRAVVDAVRAATGRDIRDIGVASGFNPVAFSDVLSTGRPGKRVRRRTVAGVRKFAQSIGVTVPEPTVPGPPEQTKERVCRHCGFEFTTSAEGDCYCGDCAAELVPATATQDRLRYLHDEAGWTWQQIADVVELNRGSVICLLRARRVRRESERRILAIPLVAEAVTR